MQKLIDSVSGRDNNFNLLRMLAASSVLISHAYPISVGDGTTEPLESTLKISLGTLAVLTFFAISGFFISQSFERRHSFADFWVVRILRIYSALLMVLLLTIFVVGPIFTTLRLGTYYFDNAIWLYLPRNLSLKWLQYDLPGVFRDNPYPAAINGSLWTLFYEVTCYAAVAVVGVSGLTTRGWRFKVFLGIYIVGYLALKLIDWRTHLLERSPLLENFHQLTLPFVVGMVFYRFRRYLPLNVTLCALAGGGVLLMHDGPWFGEILVIAWSYWIFYLGYLPVRQLMVYNSIGDYSYGMYIYAFPLGQITAAVWVGISPLGLMAVSFPATLALAVLSWHLLERRALALRPVVAGWLERNLPQPLAGRSAPPTR
jgi:peptidoglycan/LPS O-acetylase OafA/YrhL